MSFKVKETNDGRVKIHERGGENSMVLTRHEALMLAIQLIIASTPMGAGEAVKALAEAEK